MRTTSSAAIGLASSISGNLKYGLVVAFIFLGMQAFAPMHFKPLNWWAEQENDAGTIEAELDHHIKATEIYLETMQASISTPMKYDLAQGGKMQNREMEWVANCSTLNFLDEIAGGICNEVRKARFGAVKQYLHNDIQENQAAAQSLRDEFNTFEDGYRK